MRIESVLVTPAPGLALKVSQAYHIALRGNQALPTAPSQLSSALTSPFSLVIVKDDDNCMDGRAQPSPPAVFLFIFFCAIHLEARQLCLSSTAL